MPGTASRAVEFPEYRSYESTRQAANNAMMALLAGSKLAAHTLQLTAGSTQLLPDIFPGVEHISYFNLRTDRAAELLDDPGRHLGAVAIPYALAVHEDFVMTVIALLESLGYERKAPGESPKLTKNRVAAWNMHEAVWLTLGSSVDKTPVTSVALELFHILREMRNCHIHAGGDLQAAVRLKMAVADAGLASRDEWARLARRPLDDVVAGERLHFTTFDIFAAFAVTKTVGREVNSQLRDGLSRGDWARICVGDYAAVSTKEVNSDRWARGLVGHAALHYGATAVTETDVLAAATVAGYWPEGREVPLRRAARLGKARRIAGTGHPKNT